MHKLLYHFSFAFVCSLVLVHLSGCFGTGVGPPPAPSPTTSNTAPSLSSISNQTVAVNVAIAAINANDANSGGDTDSDGDALTFSCTFTHDKTGGSTATDCTSLSGTVGFSTATGSLTWTPNAAAAVGSATTTYTFTISASDGIDSGSASFTIAVTPVSNISVSIGSTSITESSTYSFGIVPSTITYDATSFTITNSGANDITVSSIGISGTNSTEFSVSSTPSSVSAGSTGTFSLLFDPTADSGSTLTSTVTISSNATNDSSFSFTLSGITKWLGSFVDGNLATGINYDTSQPAQFPHAVVFNSKLYATWQESNGGNTIIKAYVFNGSDSSPSWTRLHAGINGGLNKSSAQDAISPMLAVFNSKLYATFLEWDGNANQVRVSVYNGDDNSPSWSLVDGNGASGLNKNVLKAASNSQLYAFNDKLYLTWSETNVATQIRTAVYNGNDSSPSWSFVDGNGADGLNKNTANNAGTPKFIAMDSKLYLGWLESQGGAYQVRTTVYNGNDSSPSWTFVDGNAATGLNKNSARTASSLCPIVFNNKLYLSFGETDGTAIQIRALVYNGNDSSPSWTFVDGNAATGINKDTTKNATTPNLVVFKDKLYASWDENDGTFEQIRLKAYNGNDTSPSWVFADGDAATGLNKNTSQLALAPILSVLNSSLYALWYEHDGTTYQIRARAAMP